ncbi:hypothetical protein [Glutamicibacter ardleyensis]|uniref:Uncharacterized protein n=1 Tax=Glutamicibacter ardleyensis TaxID=225894 RepID=A0ABQ2DWF2_9MICC|nr:hypothetical protein [Glutamicibacter ardleyensis]GGJ72862.1 hypothetical protein GCM10007173_34850 [Glutamicibacter ardleyensis]
MTEQTENQPEQEIREKLRRKLTHLYDLDSEDAEMLDSFEDTNNMIKFAQRVAPHRPLFFSARAENNHHTI